jgi:hypothetical protein
VPTKKRVDDTRDDNDALIVVKEKLPRWLKQVKKFGWINIQPTVLKL